MNSCYVGLRDQIEPAPLKYLLDRFREQLFVPVEGKRSRRAVRVERGVHKYVVGHEFHRRR